MTRWSKYHKYHASKVVYEGQTFDSRKELKRYKELILLQQAGEIKNLQRQVKYTLIPEQRENDRRGPRGGVIKGTLVERMPGPEKRLLRMSRGSGRRSTSLNGN